MIGYKIYGSSVKWCLERNGWSTR